MLQSILWFNLLTEIIVQHRAAVLLSVDKYNQVAVQTGLYFILSLQIFKIRRDCTSKTGINIRETVDSFLSTLFPITLISSILNYHQILISRGNSEYVQIFHPQSVWDIWANINNQIDQGVNYKLML